MKFRRIALFVFVVSLLFTLVAFYKSRASLMSFWYSRKAVSSLQKESPREAYQAQLKALSFRPFSAGNHLNLGLVYMASKDFERAFKSAQVPVELGLENNEELLFASEFNSAVAATQLKDIDGALEHYQKALEHKPNSFETRFNIELLLQAGGGQAKGSKQDQNPQDKDQNDKDGNQDQKNQEKKAQNEMPKGMPQPYKGKELDKKDVDKILEELKNQEQRVRSRFDNQKSHAAPNDKDW